MYVGAAVIIALITIELSKRNKFNLVADYIILDFLNSHNSLPIPIINAPNPAIVKYLAKSSSIKNFTNFDKDQIICVVEETHKKFLAVGRSLVSSDELSNLTKGEIVKNLHYISDRFWEAAKQIKK